MREATEAADNIAVFLSMANIVAARKALGKKRDASFLLRKVFRMHERHIKECAVRWRRFFVVSSLNSAVSVSERFIVVIEGFSAVAMNVAGELVEEDD